MSSELTEAKRKNALLEVILLRMQGEVKTVAEACEKVGISLSAYYTWHKEYPELEVIFRDLRGIEQRLILDAVLGSTVTLVTSIIEEGIKSKNIPDKIMVYNFARELAASVDFHLPEKTVDPAKEYISRMPKLKLVSNKMASMEVQGIKDGVRLDIYGPDDVIDATPTEDPE